MRYLLSSLALAFVLTSCLSFSSGQVSQTGVKKGDVLLPPLGEYDEYLPELTRVLRKHGFNPVGRGEAPYSLSLYVGGGASMTSRIMLFREGVPVVTAKANNPGFGTWLARGSARSLLFRDSLEQFDELLAGL